MGRGVVPKSELEPVMLASEKRESERPDWITVGLDTVIGFK
jgi:hypothetical protein